MVSWQGQSPATIFLPSYFIFYRYERYKATRERERERETMSERGEPGRTCKSSSRVSAVDAYFFRGTRLDRGQLVLTRAQKGERGLCAIHRVGDYQCDAVLSFSLFLSLLVHNARPISFNALFLTTLATHWTLLYSLLFGPFVWSSRKLVIETLRWFFSIGR